MRLEHLLSGEMLIVRFLLSASLHPGLFIQINNETQEKDEAEPRGEVELVL